MTEYGDPARPGVVPASPRTAGTMFAALYGGPAPQEGHGPDPEHDAYALFHQRSLAMGWHDDRSAGGDPGGAPGAPGLWAVNDAGWDHPLADPGAGLVSWFQAEAGAVAGDRPLPVQPFLRCAWDVTARAGTTSLTAVQVLVPVQGIDTAARPPYAIVPSAPTAGWFAGRGPRTRTPVEVEINSGRDPSAPAVAQELTDRLGRLDQEVFAPGAREGNGKGAAPAPPFDDSFWNGPPLHGAVLHGELAEWSCEAVGWLAEVAAESAAGIGLRSPLLFTVTRAVQRK